MTSMRYIVLAALVGVVTGFFTIHSVFEHSWTSMILWIVVGLVLLYFSPDRKTALYASAAFGFLDIASWLLSGFQGASNQLPGFIVLMLGLSMLGAVCGYVGAMLFYRLFRRS